MSKIERKYCLIRTSYLDGFLDIFILLHIWQNCVCFGDRFNPGNIWEFPDYEFIAIHSNVVKREIALEITLFVLVAFRNITWTLQVLLNIAPKPKLNPMATIHNSSWRSHSTRIITPWKLQGIHVNSCRKKVFNRRQRQQQISSKEISYEQTCRSIGNSVSGIIPYHGLTVC